MFDRTILVVGLAVAVATAAIVPAKAEPVGGILAAGVVGAIFGAGIASTMRSDDADVTYVGPNAPRLGRYAPYTPGPGRHVVCARQDRYDRYERYVGSQRVCWVEAY